MALGGFGGGAALRSRLRRLFGAMGPSTLGKPADSSRASASVRLRAQHASDARAKRLGMMTAATTRLSILLLRILLPMIMIRFLMMALVMLVVGEVGACEGDADVDDDDV